MLEKWIGESVAHKFVKLFAVRDWILRILDALPTHQKSVKISRGVDMQKWFALGYKQLLILDYPKPVDALLWVGKVGDNKLSTK
jgi:hypothetical protein